MTRHAGRGTPATSTRVRNTVPQDARGPPSEPVTTLEIHGTADGTVRYGGSLMNGKTYPSAQRTVEDWAAANGCQISSACW